MVVIRALKNDTHKSNGTAIYYFDVSSTWRSDSNVLTKGKTKNKIQMLFLSERCINNFKDLEVAIEIWSSLKRATIIRNAFRLGVVSSDLT